MGIYNMKKKKDQNKSEAKRNPALIYAAALGTKGEASQAVQRLLAHINNGHANMPTGIVFRLYSDQGGEFNSD